jgi:vitamin B12 transporter
LEIWMPVFSAILAASAAFQPVASADATLIVSARVPIVAERFGGSVSVLGVEELARLQSPLLADVLRLQPGVTVSFNGGAGGFAAVRLRGAEGEQTTLIIDGVKVADPASPGGGADFANLSTAQIGRVEILRGPQSLAWGSQAIGGVIAVETRAPGAALAADARIEGGSRKSGLARGDVSGRIGAVALSVGGNWQRTDGISAAAESRGSTERDDYESWGGALRADVEIVPGLVADLRGRFQRSEVGIDGFAPPTFAFGDTDDRQRTRELSGVVGLGYRSERLSARVGWQGSDVDRRNYAPGQGDSFSSDGRMERLDLRGDWVAGDWLTVAAGLEREVTRIETEDAFTPAPFTARATLEGGWVQALLAPMDGLDLQAGLRHDEHSRFGGATTLAASGSWRVTDPLRLRASWGEGFKAPTLFQLFSDFGNETLKPERATGWDVGADLSLPIGLTASGSWFQRVTRDQIDFASCFGVTSPICVNRPFGVYDNIARTRTKGLEMALKMQPTDALTVQASYSHIDARNRTDGSPNAGNQLARRPDHTLALVADWQARAWGVGGTLAHVSGSFDNASNTRRIEGHVTADLRARIAIGARLELYGRVTNLFDATYETVSFYGQPGRQAHVGLRARL